MPPVHTVDELAERLESLRPVARKLARLAPASTVTDDAESSKIVVAWEFRGVPVSAQLGWASFALEVAAPGKAGEFFLGCFEDEEDDSAEEAWTELEKEIFVSKYCRFCSEKTDDEVACFLSLSAASRDCLTDLCERYRSYVSFENERLTLGLGSPGRHPDATAIFEHGSQLAEMVKELPSDRPAPRLARLYVCGYCRAEQFMTESVKVCFRCGAPRAH